MIEWNKDYLNVEPDRLWVHQDYEPAFRELGWTTTTDLLQATLAGVLGRRRDYRWRRGWDNVKLDIPSTSYSTPRSFLFMKRHRAFWHWRDSAFREARAALICQAGSVPCMKVVACGTTTEPVTDGQGRWFSSIFISEPIGKSKSVSEMTYEALSQGKEGRDSLLEIIDAVAKAVGKMHSCHVYHGDCHLWNFILADEISEQLCIKAIDLQSSRIGPSWQSYRSWLRDMCLVRSWWIRLGVKLDDLNYWYSRYRHWAPAEHVQRWMKRGGQHAISVQGDLEIVRRGLSRFSKLQFARGCEILRQRYRAA